MAGDQQQYRIQLVGYIISVTESANDSATISHLLNGKEKFSWQHRTLNPESIITEFQQQCK